MGGRGGAQHQGGLSPDCLNVAASNSSQAVCQECVRHRPVPVFVIQTQASSNRRKLCCHAFILLAHRNTCIHTCAANDKLQCVHVYSSIAVQF